MNTEIDRMKQSLEREIERLKVINEELDPQIKENGKKLTTLQSEHEVLKDEVKQLKTGYGGDDKSYKEYLKQLRIFDKFRFLRQKGTTQLPNRFAQVTIGGNNYLADRAMPRVFLRAFLTTLVNFDAPEATKITNAFNNRTGNQALVANTDGANPTKFSAD
ncbi:19805_t:CDS:1 [Entrophospora sp. SA101]|nr:14671_t:CDS:1 [Entrophospora sp. SA101]CAJ0747279.1 19805_t:CDS:1 [Entrophospora sp. SA101]CAJ0832370.1 10187_t:CDS:1 [Entrophospora sp. SA101]CAJ0890617.1 2741_t:CDS:1 [Entrophospora sp. SA101]